MTVEAVTEKDTAIYGIARVFAFILFHTLMPVKYHGAEKLKNREPPFVLISNHLHALDPMILAYPVKSQCVFLGKKELAINGLIKFFLTKIHCILVDRHHTDMEAMRACMNAIRMKKVLVIFPEGTRHHEGQMEQIESGTSLIVMRGKAPVVPVYLDSPLKLFHRVNAYIGDPVAYEDLLKKGINVESCEELNDRFRDTFRRMIRNTEQS